MADKDLDLGLDLGDELGDLGLEVDNLEEVVELEQDLDGFAKCFAADWDLHPPKKK
jgi:hypothetical protein